jgi:hypothetical protein
MIQYTKHFKEMRIHMFKCSKCNSTFHLPVCGNCGYEIKKLNNIWQLSYMPDVVTEGEDKYIGYEHINDHYSGKGKYLIEEKDALFAKELADLTGDGIFLDLACGDGCFTVPCAVLWHKNYSRRYFKQHAFDFAEKSGT